MTLTRSNPQQFRFLFICIITALTAWMASSHASAEQQPVVPAGSPMSDTIYYQFAIYYLPVAKNDPLKVLKKHIASKDNRFKLVAKLPDSTQQILLQAHLEKNVQKNYAPLDTGSLKYFGRGLSKEQADSYQKSREVLILNFAYPKKYAWKGLRAANQLLENLAKETNGLLWDEMTREIFTVAAWHDTRMQNWDKGIANISNHTTIHAYKNGDFIRAISLGMSKFGLPDVVVENFVWSSNRNVGHIINMFCQLMAEGANFDRAGEYDLNIKSIQHPAVRDPQLKSLLSNATAIARLSLRQGVNQQGDPDNRLIEIQFDRYPGNDAHTQLDAMLTSLFGAEDQVIYIQHTAALEAASADAKSRLPELRTLFNKGLAPGEYIQIKAPFATPGGGQEWMWVEVNKWQGDEIEGLLKNEPHDIPDLHGGQLVKVRQQDVFDYYRRHPDGREEGNRTSEIIQKMQQQSK